MLKKVLLVGLVILGMAFPEAIYGASYTPNLRLKKPTKTETGFLDAHNSNMQTIDTKVNEALSAAPISSLSYGTSVLGEWIADPSITTDQADTTTAKSLAKIISDISGASVDIRLPAGTYYIWRNYTVPATIKLKPDIGVTLTPYRSIRETAFKWTKSGSGTSEYYLELSGGGNPGVYDPSSVYANSVALAAGTAGSLTAGTWDWADNDSLGYSTVYIRLADSTDPDTKTAGYVEAWYTLTINGPFEAGPYQVFSGTGTVTFGGLTQTGYAEWFGAVGDYNGTTGTDNTAALKRFFASGLHRFVFGKMAGRYKVQLTKFADLTNPTTANFLANFVNTTGITIEGHGATLEDTEDKGNYYTIVFGFSNCSQVKISGINYVGAGTPHTGPTTGGAIFVYAINGGGQYDVVANVKYARYGIASGEYNSYTKGNVKDWRINLNCEYTGYPVAFWFSGHNTEAVINCSNIKRACYLAGVDTAKFKVRLSTLYAQVGCLVTSARSAATEATGCKNIDIDVTDTGSINDAGTVYYLCGLIPSMIPDATSAYGAVFTNIKFRFYVVNNDTYASTTGGFAMYAPYSGASVAQNANITINGLDVSGEIDSSGHTGTISGGTTTLHPLYISTSTDSSVAVDSSQMRLYNLRIHDLRALKSNTAAITDVYNITAALYGLQGNAIVDNVYSTYGLAIYSNYVSSPEWPQATVTVSNSQAPYFSVTGESGRHIYINSQITNMATQAFNNKESYGSAFGTSGEKSFILVRELTLSGASTKWYSAIPANCLLESIVGEITDTITGASGIQVGIEGATTRYADKSITAIGDAFNIADYDAGTTGPLYYGSATNLVITAKTSNFTGGKLRIWMRGRKYSSP